MKNSFSKKVIIPPTPPLAKGGWGDLIKKQIKKTRRYFVYLAVRLLVLSIWYLPFKAKSSIGAFGGWVCYLILRKDRKRAEENIKFVFGNKFSEKEIKDTAKISFINLGRNGIEALHIPKINLSNLKNYVSVEGLEHLDEALKKGKGAIVITGHIGNWEFFPASISLMGYPTAVISRRYSNQWIDEILKNLRVFHGTKVIVREKGYENHMMKEVLEALRNNEILGLLIDQYTRRGFLCVDFFGKPATTPTGTAVFAMKTGASVLPGCVIRRDKDNFLIKFYPPEEVVITGDREKDIYTNTLNFTKAIERMITEYPSQWAWMHDRWKLKEKQKLKIKSQNEVRSETVGADLASAPLNPHPASSNKRATSHESRNPKLPLVEIYSKPHCSLCEEAKKILLKVKETLHFELKEIDISSDNSVLEKYKEQIPIIFINGKKAFKFHVDEEELKKKLIRG